MSIRYFLYMAFGVLLILLMVSVYTGYQQSERTISHLTNFSKNYESTLHKIQRATSLMLIADHNFQLLSIPPEISPNDVSVLLEHLRQIFQATEFQVEQRQYFETQTALLSKSLDVLHQTREKSERLQLLPPISQNTDQIRQQIFQIYRQPGEKVDGQQVLAKLEIASNLLTELEIHIGEFAKQDLFDPQRVIVPLEVAQSEVEELIEVTRAAQLVSGYSSADIEMIITQADYAAYPGPTVILSKTRLEVLTANITRLISAINHYVEKLANYDPTAAYNSRTSELVAVMQNLVRTQLTQMENEIKQNIRRSQQGLIGSSIDSQDFFLVLSIASIIISLIIALYISGLISSSIKVLQEGAREFSSGNLKFRFRKLKTAEFGEVSEVFNQMATVVEEDQIKLRSIVTKLNKINRELDFRVASRTQELEDAMQEATEANQAKSQFLSSMSHELRTPLNAILGFSQLFEYDKNLKQEQRDNARKVYQAGSHLLTLVDEILDLSRIETGELELSMEPVSLSELLVSSVTWVDKMANSLNVTLQFDKAQFKDKYVQADAIKLKQVFLNLLSNAVKYNNKNGSVRIHCNTEPGDRIRIGITDTGAGLSDSQISGLFQPFNRLGAESSAIEGTGIGLVITRKLINIMQGEIEVDSVQGKGSTFWVVLPMARSEHVEHMIKPARSFGRNGKEKCSNADRTKILVAEDVAVNRDLIKAQLDLLGYEADFVGHGGEALELWQKDKYQLLMTDIRMPVMDGHELIRRIRSMETNNERVTPIIAITANAMAGDEKRCFEVGASDVMTKPFKLEDLRQTLEKWSN